MTLTHRMLRISALLFTMVGLGAAAEPPVQTKAVLSPVYSIDKIYRSMEGPSSAQQVTLLDQEPPELLWITGFRTEMMGADGQTPSKPEYMCHVNLDLDVHQHRALFGAHAAGNARVLTLSQGELSVRLPQGFGMPVMSNEPLSLTTQVLNLNDPTLHAQVRHKVTFEFVRDRDLKEPMKPLFDVAPFVMVPLDEPKADNPMADMSGMHGSSCLPPQSMAAGGAPMAHEHAPNAHGASIYKDKQGRPMSGHWVVPPGRSEARANVTAWMNLPYDTTLHFAAVHLHPYAESLELRDLTTNTSIFKSHARNPKNRMGLDAVENYSSETGTPLYKDHQYELVSVYNNPTTKNSDSMALMLLFMLDKDFQKPSLTPLPPVAAVSGEPAAPLDGRTIKALQRGRILMQTSLGDLVLTLDPKSAPQTAMQFMALARTDAYAGVPAVYLQPGFLMQWGQAGENSAPLTPAQQALVKKLPLEIGALTHQRGVLSMARDPNNPNRAISSFCILFGPAAYLDGHYTAFGRVEGSTATLAALEAAAHDAQGKPTAPPAIMHMAVYDSPAALKKRRPRVQKADLRA